LTDHATQRDINPARNSSAYFNGLILKGQGGELRLHNSLFGILKKDATEENLYVTDEMINSS
jgi:hypothetical protein